MARSGTEMLVPTHPTAVRLLDAAVRQMDAEGEAGLRVDAVVADAGVTIPVLYHHYGNREGLVRSAHAARLRRSMDDAIAIFGDAVGACEDPESFRATIDALLERVAAPNQDRAVRVNVLGATYGRPELQTEIATLQRSAWTRVAQALEEPQRRGWIVPDLRLEPFVAWMFGLIIGRILLDIQPGGDDGTWSRLTREAIHRALFDAPPAD